MNHICGDCQSKHGPNARYCRDCGEPLSLACSQCNFLNEINAKFCEACGTAFSEKTPQSNDLVGTSERRQLTVMFCDLVGSTPLSEQLDPEILSEIVVAYREAVAGAIQPYQGHIARYMGDGMLIYFGFPEAHEDDPRRAVLAALAIIQSLESVNKQMASQYGQSIALRIGIHTGQVRQR